MKNTAAMQKCGLVTYNKLDSKVTVNVPLMGDTLMSRFSLYKTKK